MTLKIVLLKAVEKLGREGDVCNVAEGYARNFLFPKKLAVPATPQTLAEAERLKKQREREAELDLSRAEELADRLDGFELEVSGKANESGTLFAAVTKKTIVDALKKKGFSLQERHVVLEEPVKELGEYEVRLELPHGLEAVVRVIINAG